ncbi:MULTISPECIES: adenylate/guanylate cyclase domain-containing protein [Catenuloplanes]|uniref:Class 3 adenylate cyclase n=1 Tax=Catenuloplanes niger TaxID=587534 RepID=A0AAE3ZQE4_9ACTN|nr:adenylate/guanylate cyclase domain-containing protein [Catenuloplanes niger]MDR7324169.1 class 3 adenylate cyclase [Catenuloplanes niger]
MRSNYQAYDHIASALRMNAILNQSDVDYTEVQSLPDRSKLTYGNGFYANCTAVFIDIRGSSKLPQVHRRPTLARIYRSYISEIIAVMNSLETCNEVNIVGDGAWGIYDTPKKPDINAVFSLLASMNSVIQMLNKELARKAIAGLTVGIGASWGRALVIKAGYSGSGISDVVYMGDVVNSAAKLAAAGNQSYGDQTIMMSDDFHTNLQDTYKAMTSINLRHNCFQANVVNSTMEAWTKQYYG